MTDPVIPSPIAGRFFSPNQQQFLDGSSVELAGGFLYFFATGSSTPHNTWQDHALTVPNTNPVVLDSAGRAGNIFMDDTLYKVVLVAANGDLTSPIWTADPVSGAAQLDDLETAFQDITDLQGEITTLQEEVAALQITHSAAYFQVPGAYDFTVPDNVTWIDFELWGAGGGGSGAYGDNVTVQGQFGSGGGGGGYAAGGFTVTPGETISGTIGTPGSGGATIITAPEDGTAGTSTTITGGPSATGGGGGTAPGDSLATAAPGGAGGVGLDGALNFTGQTGGESHPTGQDPRNSAPLYSNGLGGDSPRGGPGGGDLGGAVGNTPGGGGTGGGRLGSLQTDGGNGAPGAAYFTW